MSVNVWPLEYHGFLPAVASQQNIRDISPKRVTKWIKTRYLFVVQSVEGVFYQFRTCLDLSANVANFLHFHIHFSNVSFSGRWENMKFRYILLGPNIVNIINAIAQRSVIENVPILMRDKNHFTYVSYV